MDDLERIKRRRCYVNIDFYRSRNPLSRILVELLFAPLADYWKVVTAANEDRVLNELAYINRNTVIIQKITGDFGTTAVDAEELEVQNLELPVDYKLYSYASNNICLILQVRTISDNVVQHFAHYLLNTYPLHEEIEDFDAVKELFALHYSAYIDLIEEKKQNTIKEEKEKNLVILLENINSNLYNTKKKEIEEGIKALDISIINYNKQLSDLYTNRTRLYKDLAFMQLTEMTEEEKENICKVVRRKEITNIQYRNNTLILHVVTPLKLYNREDAEHLIQSSRKNYMNSGEKHNLKFIQSIFRGEIKVMLHTTLEIDLSSGMIDCITQSDYTDALPNPHHYYYACFGDYTTKMREAAANSDTVQIIQLAIMAVAGINVLDSPVMDKFKDEVTNFGNTKAFYYKDSPDEKFSYNDWLKKIELEEELADV